MPVQTDTEPFSIPLDQVNENVIQTVFGIADKVTNRHSTDFLTPATIATSLFCIRTHGMDETGMDIARVAKLTIKTAVTDAGQICRFSITKNFDANEARHYPELKDADYRFQEALKQHFEKTVTNQ